MDKVENTKFDEFLKDKELSEKSKNQYNVLKNRLLGSNILESNNEEDYIKFFKEQEYWKTVSTIYKYLNITEKYLQFRNLKHDNLKKWLDELEDILKVEKKKNEKKEVENNNNLKKKFNDYKFENDNDYLCLGFIIYNLSPRSDLMTLKCKDYNKDKDNYIDFENKQIVYNTLIKTNKTFKGELPRFLDIPDNIFEKVKLRNNETYLISCDSKDRSNWFSKHISKLTSKVFGEDISLTELRQSRENTENLKAKTSEEVIENAHSNGHKVKTSIENYSRKVKQENIEVEKYKLIKINNEEFIIDLETQTAFRLK